MTDSVAWKVTQLCGLLLDLNEHKQQKAIDLLSAIIMGIQAEPRPVDLLQKDLKETVAWTQTVTQEAVNEYVWCDYTGVVHENTPDPDREGPQETGLEDSYYETDHGWAKERRVEEYGDRDLWFFRCPGPHKKLQVTHEEVE